MATRERVNVDLDAEVAAILRKHAAEAHVSEGEILDRAVRAYDLRALLARLQAKSDLDEDQAMALAREELKAARTARHAVG
jgi:Ribbon-helix-helix protein, copG family